MIPGLLFYKSTLAAPVAHVERYLAGGLTDGLCSMDGKDQWCSVTDVGEVFATVAWLIYTIVTSTACLRSSRTVAMVSAGLSSLCLVITIGVWAGRVHSKLDTLLGADETTVKIGVGFILAIVSLVLHVSTIALVYFFLAGPPAAPPREDNTADAEENLPTKETGGDGGKEEMALEDTEDSLTQAVRRQIKATSMPATEVELCAFVATVYTQLITHTELAAVSKVSAGAPAAATQNRSRDAKRSANHDEYLEISKI